MCGIFGGVYNQINLDSVCENFITNLTHRGPDGSGFFKNDNTGVFLGNTRLSILDIDNGSQPFYSSNSNIVCVQNGEIYNYKEINNNLLRNGFVSHTNCDTETILNAYMYEPNNFLSSLNGMFSICIYDQNTNEIILARDRIGVKPLYYYHYKNIFLFCSEIKPILNYIKNVSFNPYGFISYLKSNYVNSSNTIFNNIKQLEPGHVLKFQNNSISIRKYWSISDVESLSSFNTDTVNEIDNIFTSSLRLRNRSDVPVGAFLSSGLDSSLICSFYSKYINKNLKTYTLKFKDSQLDESSFAYSLSLNLGLDCKKVVFDEKIKDRWYFIQQCLDQPHGDSSFIPTSTLAEEFARYSKVVLTGDGGDEIFGGYSRYFKAIESYSNDIELFESYFNDISIFSDSDISKFSTPFLISYLNDYHDDCKDMFNDTSLTCPFNKLMNYDMKTILPNNNLIKPDRMGMRHSIEARNPLIDYRLAEKSFTFKKFNNNYQPKEPLSILYTQKFPEMILTKKRMFSVPYKSLLNNVLLNNTIKNDFILVYEFVKEFFNYELMLKYIDFLIIKKDVVKLRNLFCLFAWLKGLRLS
jgi:asparagine synthase (glutamine-hydrolysing)